MAFQVPRVGSPADQWARHIAAWNTDNSVQAAETLSSQTEAGQQTSDTKQTVRAPEFTHIRIQVCVRGVLS